MTHIVTNRASGRPGHVTDESTTDFLTRVLGDYTVDYLSRSRTTRVTDIGGRNLDGIAPAMFGAQPTTTSLLVQGAHQAYAAHLGFGLRPEVVWYAVVSELGEHIRQNIARYRGLLGPDWRLGPRVTYSPYRTQEETQEHYYRELTKALGSELPQLFVPGLSTMDHEARLALIGAYMEASGPYRNYQVPSMCAMPRVEIEGTADDWLTLKHNVERLMDLFPALGRYLNEVESVLYTIHCTVAGLEINLDNFWGRMYKWDDRICNGPYVQGWITALFAHKRNESGVPRLRTDFPWWNQNWDGFQLGEFASHVGSVPLTTPSNPDPTKATRRLVAGVLGVKLGTTIGDLPLLTPRLGWGVVNMR
ncbi:MAG TPA: DUF4419 domain-containing protein [Candidatus Saccharimonadales bacterium]|nr:DUF4419 domain-containing protein [Candidatus Saccharimonadales bacterium]